MSNKEKVQCRNCKKTGFTGFISPVTNLCADCTKDLSEGITKEITTSEVSAEFGSALVKAGQESRQKKLTEQCISTVEQLLSQITTAETNIKFQTKQLEVYKKRLEAIEKGEIEIVPNGNNVRIVYKDSELSPDMLNY